MSNFVRSLRSRLAALADLLLPRDCFVCGEPSGADFLCAPCFAALPANAAACPVCAVPTPSGAVCGACLRSPPAFDATHAALAYDFPLDRIVQALKYRQRLAPAGFFAGLLQSFGPPAGDAVLLPMPLHVRRLRERGFNQAVEIARPLARAWGLPLELRAVARTIDTAPQAALRWSARRVNMRGAFRSEASFEGRTVLVVDDVMTTGATLDELARTLKRQGAARVENLVVARTPPPA